MTSIIAVFLAAFGVFCYYMSLSDLHAEAAIPGLIAGVVLLAAAAVSLWGSFKWR